MTLTLTLTPNANPIPTPNSNPSPTPNPTANPSQATDERRWRRAPRVLKLQWRGALRPDQLRDWAPGRVGDRDGLPPTRSRQVSISNGRRSAEALVQAEAKPYPSPNLTHYS